MAPAGAVHVQADADWGGDESRKSTSGVIVWVKADTGKWYMVQSMSRKQTTVALYFDAWWCSRCAESANVALDLGRRDTRGHEGG